MSRKPRPAAKTPENEMLQRIYYQRVRTNTTQRDLAKQLGISQQTWSAYESGVSAIPIATLLKLPKILRCTIADILPAGVITEIDKIRARDPKLDEVIEIWRKLPDQTQTAILEIFHIMRDGIKPEHD